MVPLFLQASGAASDAMHVYAWEWIVLTIIVVGLILFDLLGHVRKTHEPTIKEATKWTVIYVTLAMIFAAVTLIRHNAQFAMEFLAGYITEYSLSLDNIFVFIVIMAAFKVPRKYQHKVLMYGIVVALILRFAFIMVGAALVQRFVWVFFVFGAWMLYAAIKQIIDGIREAHEADSDKEEAYRPNVLLKVVSKVFPVTEGFEGGRIVLKRNGKIWFTPLAICILSVEMSDVMFALDSIPAIFGLTNEPFLVFSSNAFALLGLRQLFFLVDGLLEKLIYLHYGLAVILGFIALKLLLHAFHGYDMLHVIPEPDIIFSVGFIILALLLTVIASLWASRRMEKLKDCA